MDTPVWRFYPISGPRAYEEVVDQITFAIRSGAFRPGMRLPLVEELSESMGVSRPTIGEAIRVLSKAGVLVSQRGAAGGVTVVSDDIPDSMIMRQPSGWREASTRELIEARRAIEMRLALLAGERATESDFTAMRYAIDQLKADPHADTMRRLHYDHLFHYAMARAARSELLAYYQHQVLEQLHYRFRELIEDEAQTLSIAELHEETLASLRSRDPKRIEAAMGKHLHWLESRASDERLPARQGRRKKSAAHGTVGKARQARASGHGTAAHRPSATRRAPVRT
ncbi:MAG: FadR/GntR family transcriptional regulator [Alphaproteobacteria bacterium]